MSWKGTLKMRMIIAIASSMLCFLTTSTVFAERIRVAVSDFKAIGIPTTTAQTISDLMRTELSNVKQFTVLERGQMDSILKEQGFQQAACSDTECAVQMGKILSANKILVGTVTKLGSRIVINGRIVDVEKAVAEAGVTEKAENDDELYDSVKSFTLNISRRYIRSSGEYDVLAQDSAFNPANHDFIIRMGYDLYASHVYTKEESGDVTTDISKSPIRNISFSFEYLYLLRSHFNLGIGVTLQAPREVSDYTTAQFSVLPIYGILKFPYNFDSLGVFILGNLGYGKWGDTKDYTSTRGSTREIHTSDDLQSGLYYGIGAGMTIDGSWCVQLQYDVFEGSVKSNEYPVGDRTDTIRYSRLMLSAGIVF